MPQTDAAIDTAGGLVLRHGGAGIATLTLNRPARYNALSEEMLAALEEQLEAVAADDNIRVVVLAGSGKAFCAGHDLKQMRARPDQSYYRELFARCSRVMGAIIALPQPVIARVHGTATAAGCQLVATCDLAIAADDARFATPGVNIGLFCHTPLVAVGRNVSRKHAMEMALTGEAMDAETAVRFGLVNRAVPPTALRAETLALARQIAGKSAYTLRIGKQALYRQLEMDLAEAYDFASTVMLENLLARDADEGIGAFIDKRQPVWQDR